MTSAIVGRVWKFGDNINTDLIMPQHVQFASEEEQRAAVFATHRPGWVDQVRPGDIVICGKNFGIGGARSSPRSLRNVGLSCLLADSINGLFFRGAVNFGLTALECAGVSSAFEEGQTAEVSLQDWTIRNRETGAILKILPVPNMLVSLMLNGGVLPLLYREGLMRPRHDKPDAEPNTGSNAT